MLDLRDRGLTGVGSASLPLGSGRMLPRLDECVVDEGEHGTCQAGSQLGNKSRRTCERGRAGDVIVVVTPLSNGTPQRP